MNQWDRINAIVKVSTHTKEDSSFVLSHSYKIYFYNFYNYNYLPID